MHEDLDLERVVNDPDYRRKAIKDLNRAEERPEDGDAQQRRGEAPAAVGGGARAASDAKDNAE